MASARPARNSRLSRCWLPEPLEGPASSSSASQASGGPAALPEGLCSPDSATRAVVWGRRTSWRKRAFAWASISSNFPVDCIRKIVEEEPSRPFTASAVTLSAGSDAKNPCARWPEPALPPVDPGSSLMVHRRRSRLLCARACAMTASPASPSRLQKAVRSISAVRRSKACGASMSGMTGRAARMALHLPSVVRTGSTLEAALPLPSEGLAGSSSARLPSGRSARRSQAARSKALVRTSASKRVLSLLFRKANSSSFRSPPARSSSQRARQGRSRILRV
mmetsp:Transcript_66608/g.210649  ORF Transcript_66608/g.210649 Transcript_66608/m.210649 type:complete len:279 (+) Transcript_66608:1223-2059(+)